MILLVYEKQKASQRLGHIGKYNYKTRCCDTYAHICFCSRALYTNNLLLVLAAN